MTTYFAFPAGESLQTGSHELLQRFAEAPQEPHHSLFVTVANAFADQVIQYLFLNMIHNMDGQSRAARILDKLAGLIKATVHTLIRQSLHNRSNEELLPLLDYVRDRQLVRQENGVAVDYVCFPLPLDLAGQFTHVFQQVDHGHAHEHRLALRDAMLGFAELSHFHFYEEPTSLLKLGFVTRKAASMGGASIKSGSRSSINQLFPQLSFDELVDFVEYFRKMFIEVAVDEPVSLPVQ